MYLGKVGNIRSANAWLAYSADTPAPPHTLEFLLMFHFVIFSEKSPFVDIETVFGKIHIFSIHFTIHSSFLDPRKCLCFPLSLWRDSKNLSFLLCLRPHWIFACNPHWTLRRHLHLDIGLNVNFRALSALQGLSWLLCMCTGIHPTGKKRRDKKNRHQLRVGLGWRQWWCHCNDLLRAH